MCSTSTNQSILEEKRHPLGVGRLWLSEWVGVGSWYTGPPGEVLLSAGATYQVRRTTMIPGTSIIASILI